MTNNDVLRSLRHLLNVNEAKLVEIAELAGCLVTPEEMQAFVKREEEPGYEECPHEVLGCFLDGLIVHKRGPAPADRPRQPVEVPITNNLVVKKLRVAFELKDTDLLVLVAKNGLQISKAELSAFFRAPDHRNYRECGDQFLRNLLKGLTR